jgi:hypothetical protein
MTKSEYKELLQRFKEKTAAINKATIETIIAETPEQQEARIKMLLKPENYGLFFNYYFGKDTPIPMADSDCAWYHTAIYRDLYYNAYMTLFNFIFRGGAKSTHANMGYPLALKQSDICKFFLVVGINENRAATLLQDLQVQLEANNRIIKDFGKQKEYGSWADGQFETTDRCTFMALGLNQPFRGLRLNGVRVEYASIDDCEDAKTALNKSLILEYAGKITGDIQGAFSKRSERTIVNNNYFVEDGLMTELLRRKGFNPKLLNTKENGIHKQKYAKIYLVNLTTKYYDQIQTNRQTADSFDWQPSWKERYIHEDCLRKIEQYENDKATLSGEFYNTPIKVGKLFKPEWIRWVKPKPLKEYDILVGHWDFSYTTTGDTKAFALIGCADGKFTVLDIFCGHYDIADALEYHFTNAKKWYMENGACIFYYDASVAQRAIYEPILMQASIQYKSFMLPLPEHSQTDKYSRVSATLTSMFRSGKLQFSETIQNNPDWTEAELQLLGFEKGTKLHDDFPDTLEAAIRLAQRHYYGETDTNNFKPVIKPRKRGGY